MIVTLTANPSLDLTLEVSSFEVGEVNRSSNKIKDPAGKGINVSRALQKNDSDTSAVFPADAIIGAWIEDQLTASGMPVSTVRIEQEVRQNLTIVDDKGVTTKINEKGPKLSEAEREALYGLLASVLESKPNWIVAAGSLPQGLDGNFYVSIGELAHSLGVRFAVDTSGKALAAVAHSGVADLLKPNHEELEELAGKPLPTVGDVVDCARTFLTLPDSAILVSLGENGALLVTKHNSIWAGHEPVTPESTVGAGDSTLAGFLHADLKTRVGHLSETDADTTRVKTAVAWGSAAVQLPATTVPGPANITIEKVQTILNPDLSTRIKELTA